MEDELLGPKIKLNETAESSKNDDEVSLDSDTESSVNDDSTFDEAQVSLAQNILGNRFQVIELVGQGGMGSIYKVNDTKSDRIVALKLLKPELCKDRSTRKRFIKEAEYLSALDNENVVSIYDYGVASNGTPYLVMQYLDGGSLDQKLQDEKPLETDNAISITLEICKALEFAHKKELVHRDIKPSNVMINDSTEKDAVHALLTDFGIAKFLKESDSKTTQLTQTGDFFGTPAYMSPEQCEGTEIDHRSDIYSLGCLLYKMVTGVEPYAGLTPVQVAVKHISSEPERFAVDYPDGHTLVSLQEVILKCMRKSRLERYQSVEEIVEDLQTIKSGKSVGYAEEEKAQKKGLMAWTEKLASSAVSLTVGLLSLMLYFLTLSSVFTKNSDSSNLGSPSNVIFYSLCGLVFFTKPAYNVLKNIKKRKPLGEWSDHLTTLTVFFTYLLCLIPLIPGLPHPISDFSVILLAVTIIFCISLFLFGVLRILGKSTKKLAYAVWNFGCRLVNKSHKPKRQLSIPIRLTSALYRIILVLAITFGGYYSLYPQAAAGVLSSFGVLDQKYNGTFAEQLMKLAVITSDNSPQKIIDLAQLYDERGNTKEALALLNKALEKKPTSHNLFYARAKIEKSNYMNRKVIEDTTKAISQHPQDSDFYSLRGQAHLELGDYGKAESDFKKALDNSTLSYGVYTSQGNLYSSLGLIKYQQKQYKQAIEYFGIAIEKGNNRNRDYLRRALAYNAAGQRLEANRNLKEAMEINSYDDSGSVSLIRAYAAKQLNLTDQYESNLKKAQEKGFKKENISKLIFNDLPMVKLHW